LSLTFILSDLFSGGKAALWRALAPLGSFTPQAPGGSW
jgi:hypothetical protein